MKEFLLFRAFIMPHALQLLFWTGIGGVLYGSWWLYSHGNWAWVMSLLFGTLFTRLIFEGFILRYRSYLRLTEISEKLGDDN